MFLKAKVKERIQRVLAAHLSDLRDAFVYKALVLGLRHLANEYVLPLAVEGCLAIGCQLLPEARPRLWFPQRLLLYLGRQEHDVFPCRELVKSLDVLQRESTVDQSGLGDAVGAVTVREGLGDGVKLLSPEVWLGPAMVHALPDDGSARPFGELRIPWDVFHDVEA